MAQLRPKIVKLAKIIGGVTGITTKIDENAPEYYCMAGILSDDEADIAIAAAENARSVMGVELPTLSLQTTSPLGIYYDLESTNGTLDVAYLKFNEVKTLTVELTEVETSVIRLAEAIQKTQKRANALGNVQIPQRQKTIKSIDEVLGEREREEFSRLKVIKAQKEKQAEEA